MKKVLVFVACIQSVLGYGMEKFDLFMHKIRDTHISVMNGCISEVDGQRDILVVGAHEQSILKRKLSDNLVVGDIGNIKSYITIRVRILGKTIDDCYPFDYSLQAFRFPLISYKKQIKSYLLYVAEPRLGKELLWNPELGKEMEDFTYSTHRYYHREKSIHLCEYYASDALEEAKKDLALCYKNSLKGGEETFPKKANRSIAFKSLSTELGFPAREASLVAAAAIIDYIKQNPTGYTTIDLFVENYSDVELYKKAFEAQ